MKKTWFWLVSGIVLIALIVGGYFYFRASADVVSGTNAGSTDVTLSMDLNYDYAANGNNDAIGKISITNNTANTIKYMKVLIPSSNPASVTAQYQNDLRLWERAKQTTTPIIGLNGHAVDTRGAWVITGGNNTNYEITGSRIETSGVYKVFPAIGYKVSTVSAAGSVPAIPAKGVYTLQVYFKKNFTTSPVTVTNTNGPFEQGKLLKVQIEKTQAVNEKSMKLYVPKKIGTSPQYIVLNYDNKQDIAVPITDQANIRGYEYDPKSLSSVNLVDIPSSLVAAVGDFMVITVYPIATVPALTKGAKYNIPIDYIKTTNVDEANCKTVAVYEDSGYGDFGAGACLAVGDYTSSKLTDLIDNISSVRVASGYKAVLYKDDNFGGDLLELTADATDLSTKNFDNLTSSIKVSALPVAECKTVEVFTSANYSGTNACLPLGPYHAYNLAAMNIPDNSISSIKITTGYSAKIYTYESFGGESTELTTSNANLQDLMVGDTANNWNDAISSIMVGTN